MNSLELDQEICKMARAMMTRNTQIGAALIAHLRTELTLEGVVGLLIVSIERVIWFDTDAIIWTTENLIPADLLQEIQKLMSFTLYKQLIAKGFVPGEDMSVDVGGKLLVKEARRFV